MLCGDYSHPYFAGEETDIQRGEIIGLRSGTSEEYVQVKFRSM